MDGVVHPNVEQAIGRDRIRKALKRYENRPADEHRYGIVRSVNEDGSYEVLLDGDVQTSRCAQYGTALVGDRVLAVTKKDGRNDLLGRLGGETIAPNIAERFEKLEPVVLYYNASGTTGTVTLSSSAANFTYLDVIYGSGDGRTSGNTRVYSPNGKTVEISAGLVGSNGYHAIYFGRYAVSGTSITPSINQTWSANLNGTESNTANLLYVIAVIGYK